MHMVTYQSQPQPQPQPQQQQQQTIAYVQRSSGSSSGGSSNNNNNFGLQQLQPQQIRAAYEGRGEMGLKEPFARTMSPPVMQQALPPLQQQQPQPQQQASSSGSFKSPPQAAYQPSVVSPLYLGHNPFIEILRPLSYADDNIVTLNLSHSHIYEIDSDAFVGQRFEYIDLSNNKLGLIHSRSFRIGPNHSRHTPYDPRANSTSMMLKLNPQHPHQQHYATRRPPPAHPKSVTIDFSHNPAIVALSGAFDHIDVPNCLLNFTNSTVELKFGAFKKYFKEHPGHIIDIDTVDCCDQEWLLGYKHNFVARTHCAHDPNLYLLKMSQQTIIDSCIAYVTSARHSMTMPGSGIIHSAAANGPRHSSGSHADNQQYLTYLILGGTAMILTSLSIYIIFYMFSLKAAFVYQMQTQKN